jgi:hypothetical protein
LTRAGFKNTNLISAGLAFCYPVQYIKKILNLVNTTLKKKKKKQNKKYNIILKMSLTNYDLDMDEHL